MITIYSKSKCMKCEMTKKRFAEKAVPYNEIKIDQDGTDSESFKNYVNFIKSTYELSEMPIVVTEHDVWSGFNLNKIRQTINEMA